jgi:hypothetical protein
MPDYCISNPILLVISGMNALVESPSSIAENKSPEKQGDCVCLAYKDVCGCMIVTDVLCKGFVLTKEQKEDLSLKLTQLTGKWR